MKTIKIFSLILIVIALILMLSACCSTSTNEKVEDTEKSRMLRLVEYYPYNGQVVVDTETGVLYWMSMGQYNHGTLTLLVNKDGTPKVLKGE